MTSECGRVSDLLSAHADDALDAAAAARVQAHVAGCARCAAELRSLESLLGELRGLLPSPLRSDATWSDFSDSVRVSWQRTQEAAQAARAGSLRRRWWRLVAGAGTALALGTAGLLLAPRLGSEASTAAVGSTSGSTSGGTSGSTSGGAAGLVLPASAPGAEPAKGASAPGASVSSSEVQLRRIEAAGRLGDELDDLDPDDLLDGLDELQLEKVGKALAPGA